MGSILGSNCVQFRTSDSILISDTRMKIFLVALFLTITFLSQIWGKHYLVKTKGGKNAKDKKISSLRDLDNGTVDAKTLIYQGFQEEELRAFKKLPKKKRKTILKDIDNIIANVRSGSRDLNLNLGVMKELKKITGGDDRVRSGLKSLLKLMPKNGEDYKMGLFGSG